MSEDFLANNNSLHCEIHLKIEESCVNEEPQVLKDNLPVPELEESSMSLNNSLNSVDTNIQRKIAENWKGLGAKVTSRVNCEEF